MDSDSLSPGNVVARMFADKRNTGTGWGFPHPVTPFSTRNETT